MIFLGGVLSVLGPSGFPKRELSESLQLVIVWLIVSILKSSKERLLQVLSGVTISTLYVVKPSIAMRVDEQGSGDRKTHGFFSSSVKPGSTP